MLMTIVLAYDLALRAKGSRRLRMRIRPWIAASVGGRDAPNAGYGGVPRPLLSKTQSVS